MEDLRTSINKQKDLKELKTFLNETFESKKIESKNDLIDYLELTYLPNYKVKIETDNQQFAKYEMSLLTSMYQQAKQRIEFIEKWIVEKKMFMMEGSKFVVPIDPTDVKDYNNDFDILKNRKVLFFENKGYLKMITATNIDAIYIENYNSFLFANSDVVTIDGEPFLNKFERLKRMKASHQTVMINSIKDGFPIIEIDFIKTELENSKFLHCKSFKEEKQLGLWIKKLNEKLVSLSTTIQEPEIIDTSKDLPEIKFDTLIFKDQESYNLFLFLVDEYAEKFRVSQFSQIYHWLIENDNRIKQGTGTKYRKHVKVNFPLMTAKFSRIEERKPYEMATLNDVFKRLAHNK